MASLEYELDKRKIHLDLEADTEYCIGSSPECPVCLRGLPGISSRHCVVCFNSNLNSFALADLYSVEGTGLNGRKIGRLDVPLHDGDRISVGPVELVFHTEASTSTRKIDPGLNLTIAQPESFAGVHAEKSGGARFRKMEHLDSGEIIEEQLPSGNRTENYLIRTPDGTQQELKVMREIPVDPAAGPELIRQLEKLPSLTGLLPVIRCGTLPGGECFCVTEYRDVPTYAKMISMLSPLPAMRALALIYMPAVILSRCWQNGFFHGELTPDDILYEPQTGNTLAGMGLSQWRNRFFPQRRTRPCQWYAAPETTDGESVWQSDQYALGIMLFQLLTGVLPFYAEDAEKLAEMHRNTTMPLPQERNPQIRVPAPVNAVLVRMTMKSPDARYRSWEELLENLEKANTYLKKNENAVS